MNRTDSTIPLRRKLLFAVFLTSVAAWVLAALVIAGYEQWTFRDRTARDLSQKAQLLSLNLTAALQFGDKQAANDILATLSDLPEVSLACVYDASDALFVTFARVPSDRCAAASHPADSAFSIQDRQARLLQPVLSQGQKVGLLQIAADVPSFASRLPQYGLALSIVLLALGSVSLLLRGVLQRMLLDPILSLAQVARAVAAKGELGARAQIGSRDEIGELAHAMNQMLDRIQDRERQLSASRNLLQSIIDNTPATIYAMDLEGRYLIANRSYAAIANSVPEAIAGHTVLELFEEPVAESLMASDREVIERDGPVVKEETVAGEAARTYLAVRFPLRDASGAINAVGGIATDITERKQAEEELELHRHNLERLVEQRTGELGAAKNAAEAATQAKSAFLANMSHEIRTPMNAIVGLTYLLRRSNRNPDEQEKLRKVSDAAQHLLSIINNILDISKIESGKLRLEDADFQLETLLRENVFGLIGDRAQAKGLEIIFDIDPRLAPTLRGDRVRVAQLILNYASNAVKFTERGSIVFRARVEEETESEVMLRFEVTDSGVGLSREQLGRMFETFEQADSSTTRKYGGTGLGLVINRHLAAIMGGEVGATSKVGVGSTFWFTVRLRKGAEGKVRKINRRLQGAKALVADDVADARAVISAMLANFGLRVTEADGGAAAVAEIEAADALGDPFDLLIVDWRMPLVDGIEVARRIQKLNLSKPPAYFMVTAFDEPSLREEAARLGFSSVLIKPVTASTLHDTLSDLVEGVSQARTAESEASAAERALRNEHQGRRLLLAEDNPVNREVTLELLRDVGLDVDVVENGREAVERAGNARYDLVLMDMQMPEMDGLEATRNIRALPGWADIPIIAMTANAFGEDRAACLAAGMNDHLGKPATPEDLFGMLFNWLAKGIAPATGGKPQAGIAAPPAPAKAPPSADPASLLPSLDVAKLMAQAKQQIPRLRRLLQLAVAEHRDDAARLAESAARNDFEAARKIAHHLKGTAGQIEAGALHALARRAEDSWRGGRPIDDSQLQALTKSLNDVLAEIDRYLAATAT